MNLSLDAKNSLQRNVELSAYTTMKVGGAAEYFAEPVCEEELLSAFNLHLISFHKILGCLLQGMKSREAGSIINIISTSVKQPLAK